MSDFIRFKNAVQAQIASMAERGHLFRVDASKDELWEAYLKSFPPGTNEIFKERTEHDCQCCKQFIRTIGNAVAVIDGEVESIWDISIGGAHQVVADALSDLVKSKAINDALIHYEAKVGTDHNHQDTDAGVIRWDHFSCILPDKYVKSKNAIPAALGDIRSSKDVFKRGCEEITVEAIDTVLELIEQNSLYRGAEHTVSVGRLGQMKSEYDALSSAAEKDNHAWTMAATHGHAVRIRNSVIGTLLTDISEGMELDAAVRAFESKVAPTNYKRPTALITKAMIDKAQKKVCELGIKDSLSRRFAVTDDLTINNVLFANRTTKQAMNVFEEMSQEAGSNVGSLDKVEEVGIDKFITDILPKADKIEVMVENKHSNNLVSLIAPVHADSKNILKWDNNFSWSYNGEVTDSIKERVRKAGGNIDAVLRCSLSWGNYDDLDIHVVEPGGNHIYFNNKVSRQTSGQLDVDMNAGSGKTREAVENIVWTDLDLMQEGEYKLYVNNYSKRETIDVGFDVELEFDGVIHLFNYAKPVKDSENVAVSTFTFSRKDGIKFLSSLDSTAVSKEIWGLHTNNFHNVAMVMNSPNHWDGEETGNKHWFFMLDGCVNDGRPRGFFNEFLNNNLTEYRKVFEVLGSKMKVAESNIQLSGVGFSSTKRDYILCKVTGSFSRIIKIIF